MSDALLFAPRTPEETAKIVRAFSKIRVPHFDPATGSRPTRIEPDDFSTALPSAGTSFATSESADECLIYLDRQSGVVDYSPADQVATFRSGTTLAEVQAVLGEEGQCLPFARQANENCSELASGWNGPLGELIGLNFPHALEYLAGNWRDWVLGLRVVLADGSIAHCGSHAVKNVAGYDVQKLMIGARGSLGIVVEVTLRTTPIARLPASGLQVSNPVCLGVNWIQRIPPAASDRALDERLASAPSLVHAYDRNSGTIWMHDDEAEHPPRFAGDWVLDPSEPGRFLSATTQAWMQRAKLVFDPAGKLNIGEWGFM